MGSHVAVFLGISIPLILAPARSARAILAADITVARIVGVGPWARST